MLGVRACIDGEERRILARRGVVLACGGFESAPRMHQRYWQVEPVLSAACRGNTGDGIRMAQRLGADLWHMWHFHGSYGFRHPAHLEIGIRMKRLPDWSPAGPDTPSNSEARAAPMAWILVDRDGRRFMNEYPPYVQDTGHRPLEPYDPATLRFPRVPCWCVFDETARRLYPMGSPVLNDRVASRHYDWSADNLKETGNGLLHAASSLAELAGHMDVCPETLEQTVAGWNSAVARGTDPLGRPAVSMVPVATPPFYCGQIWPVVSNTQGGPRHDPQQRVLDPFDQVIPGSTSQANSAASGARSTPPDATSPNVSSRPHCRRTRGFPAGRMTVSGRSGPGGKRTRGRVLEIVRIPVHGTSDRGLETVQHLVDLCLGDDERRTQPDEVLHRDQDQSLEQRIVANPLRHGGIRRPAAGALDDIEHVVETEPANVADDLEPVRHSIESGTKPVAEHNGPLRQSVTQDDLQLLERHRGGHGSPE